MLEISSTDLTYVTASVRRRAAGSYTDLSGDSVKCAFLPPSDVDGPATGDWKAAVWDVDATTSPPTYRAACLVGAGGTVTLAAGDWVMWVQVTHSPEVKSIKCGPLRVVD